MIQIVVFKNSDLRFGQPGAVDDAGVVEAVAEENVAFGKKAGDGADGGLVAAAKGEGGFGFFEGGELSFQFPMGRERACDQTRSAAASAVSIQRVFGRLFEGGVVGEAKVVIGGKGKHRPAVALQLDGLRPLDRPHLPQQVLASNRFEPSGKILR